MKSDTYPKVTILLATFNRAYLILETLTSIKNQTFINFECLITDDNSTDDTEIVVNKFIKTDSRFYYFKKPKKYHQGLSATRNFGLDLAQNRNAEFIQFFDDDDIMHPQKLELQIQGLLSTDADFSLCASTRFFEKCEITNESKKLYRFNHFADDYFLGKIHFGAPIPIFRFTYINKNRFDTALHYAEEWVCFTQLFYHYYPKVVLFDKVLFYQRKHSNSITLGKDEDLKKAKSSKVSNLLIAQYLNKYSIHTILSARILAGIFLFVIRDFQVVDGILKQIKTNNLSKLLFYEIKIFKLMIHFQRKIYLKISSWF